MTNDNGVEVKIINYGAIIVSLKIPDRNGDFADVVFGYDNLEDYIERSAYFGAVVGRYGNRISKARFSLDGVEYQLPVNDGENSLHGGIKGFDKVVWDATAVESGVEPAVKLTYLSKDREEGYPGNLLVTVTYTLIKDNGLKLDYRATTDKPTVLNLTNHSYFNLNGVVGSDILDHEIMINADKFTPINEALIPTGELREVEGTPFDFRKPMSIGSRIDEECKQLEFGLGYDHNYVLNDYDGNLRLAITLYDKDSGRFMEVYTQEPGVQFYSGNFLNGRKTGKNNWAYQYRSALCLEPQHYPDSPNNKHFPSVVLKPGELYHTSTIYKFTTKP
jgi:aldose 1-epimerase